MQKCPFGKLNPSWDSPEPVSNSAHCPRAWEFYSHWQECVSIFPRLPMKPLRFSRSTKVHIPSAYIIDTYKNPLTGEYLPAAILFSGRKRIETIQWKQKGFSTQNEADMYVRNHFVSQGLSEALNEADIVRMNPSKY